METLKYLKTQVRFTRMTGNCNQVLHYTYKDLTLNSNIHTPNRTIPSNSCRLCLMCYPSYVPVTVCLYFLDDDLMASSSLHEVQV